MSDGGLPMYLVYRNPSDHPGKYVVRLWRIIAGAIVAEPAPVAVTADYAIARAAVPQDLYRIPPQPGEDPRILETWV